MSLARNNEGGRVDNIRDAIREWLMSEDNEKSIFHVTEEEVTV